jgi:hypothetical protein
MRIPFSMLPSSIITTLTPIPHMLEHTHHTQEQSHLRPFFLPNTSLVLVCRNLYKRTNLHLLREIRMLHIHKNQGHYL